MSRAGASPTTGVTATSAVTAVACVLAKSDLEAFFGLVVMVTPGNSMGVCAFLALTLVVLLALLCRVFRSDEEDPQSESRRCYQKYPEATNGLILIPRRGQPALVWPSGIAPYAYSAAY